MSSMTQEAYERTVRRSSDPNRIIEALVNAAGRLSEEMSRGEGKNAVHGVDTRSSLGYQIARACPECTELNPVSSPRCFCGKELR